MSDAPDRKAGAGPAWVRRLDDAIAVGERALIAALLIAMVGSVFLDALHRIFAAGEGRLERALLLVLPVALHAFARAALAPALLSLATIGVAYAAVRSRQPGGRRSRALLFAVGLALLAVLGTQALVHGLPNGLVWSQQMGLCFMLWVALAGASLAAREHAHIAFELAGQLWPRRWARAIERLARLLAATFSFLLAFLAAAHVREHYLEWASSGGAAGLFEAFRVPRFLVFGFLPLPFTAMGARFLIYGVRPDAVSEPA